MKDKEIKQYEPQLRCGKWGW